MQLLLFAFKTFSKLDAAAAAAAAKQWKRLNAYQDLKTSNNVEITQGLKSSKENKLF